MVNSELGGLFDQIDRDGAVSVIALRDLSEVVSYRADQVMDTGSAFKIAIALEVCCQIASGDVELSDWIQIDAEKAPIRLGTVAQALELMMSLSDNAAANALLHLAGYDRITARLAGLGLRHTTVCRDVPVALSDTLTTLQPLARAAGADSWFDLVGLPRTGHHVQTGHEVLPPGSLGPTTTAHELASLYAMIWTDRAGTAEACALVRSYTHELRNRIAAGFATTPGASFAGKGGSFPGIVANDAGVLCLPNGHRYAIAVLTRARHAYAAETQIDQHLAAIAAKAIDQIEPSHCPVADSRA